MVLCWEVNAARDEGVVGNPAMGREATQPRLKRRRQGGKRQRGQGD